MREQFLERWRLSMQDGDGLFSEAGIDAVDRTLEEFERDARRAKGNESEVLGVLRRTVLALNGIGGTSGAFGCFLETDEREELVPYLLEHVSQCGVELDDDDPTEADRDW